MRKRKKRRKKMRIFLRWIMIKIRIKIKRNKWFLISFILYLGECRIFYFIIRKRKATLYKRMWN